MTKKLLWVDDDHDGRLAPLGRILHRQGFAITSASSFEGGKERLDHNSVFDSALIDLILPYKSDDGSLSKDLGFSLAEEAALCGVNSIALLTVMRPEEVEDEINRLKRDFLESKFDFFDKTLLLEPNYLDHLIKFLQGDPQQPS